MHQACMHNIPRDGSVALVLHDLEQEVHLCAEPITPSDQNMHTSRHIRAMLGLAGKERLDERGHDDQLML